MTTLLQRLLRSFASTLGGQFATESPGQLLRIIHIAHNKQQKESYDGQVIAIGKVVDYLSKLDTAQLDKNKLKKRFSGILEHYMTEREKMTMLSKQIDKDELMRFTREQVNNL